MSLLRFHLLGEWGESSLTSTWVSSTFNPPTAAREQIESAWQEASVRPGIKLFDGPMCRLERWDVVSLPVGRKSRLDLSLSPVSYKHFFGTNLSHPELADHYGREVLANPVGVSPALETADGYLLMGRRNERVAYYPNRIHPFAGCLEPLEADKSGRTAGPDVFAAVRRELFEELSLTLEDLESIRCTGIAEDVQLRQPELIFAVRTLLTRRQLESQVARDEHHASWAIEGTAAGVERGLTDPLLTPVGVASLLLWGRLQFGDDWFASQHTPFVRD